MTADGADEDPQEARRARRHERLKRGLPKKRALPKRRTSSTPDPEPETGTPGKPRERVKGPFWDGNSGG
jgi:hypothetical protein